VCFITTEFKWKDKFDISLIPDETNGLKANSLIRIGKIATIDKELVHGE
jgi:mRNA interferase MazF